MYANARAGYFKYQKTDFLNLTPAEIVDRLFKGLFSSITGAEDAIREGLTPKKGEKISRAIAIAGELQASLDMEKGGEISDRLYQLYDFVIRELLLANMESSLDRLETIKTVIRPIMEGWSQLLEKPAAAPEPEEAVHPAPGPEREPGTKAILRSAAPYGAVQTTAAPPRMQVLQVAG